VETLGNFLAKLIELYLIAPAFFNWIVPVVVGGYVVFATSGYKVGKWYEAAGKEGLKSTNDALKTTNETLKEKNGVLEERVKLAREQAEDAKKKAEEFKAEAEELRKKVEANASREELKLAVRHLDIKASNILVANTAVSSTLNEPRVYYGGGPAIRITEPSGS
jgi:hypothetical protein